MDLETFRTVLPDYLEGRLAASEVERVEQFLATHPEHWAELDTAKEALAALSGLHKMSAPGEFSHQVTDRIRRRSAGRFFGRQGWGEKVPWQAIAALALVLLAALYLARRGFWPTDSDAPPDPDQKAIERARELVPKP